jgi:hemoglobin
MSTAVTASPNPEQSGAATSITEPMIRDLVHAFYARARRDEILGPIFEANVKDWPAHLENMCAFWSSATLRSGRYKGHPMLPHARIAEIEKAHFTRWLALFGETAAENCPAEIAALFIDRAQRFAQSLQIGIAMHRSPRTAATRTGAP